MHKQFYLAASWTWREQAWQAMQIIERASGWTCTSTWLRQKEESLKEAAERDLRDVARARLLVLLGGKPYSVGKHLELGYAMGKGLNTVLVEDDWLLHDEVRVPPWRIDETLLVAEPSNCIFAELADDITTFERLLEDARRGLGVWSDE